MESFNKIFLRTQRVGSKSWGKGPYPRGDLYGALRTHRPVGVQLESKQSFHFENWTRHF